jgi:polyhydroxyalkanoate synthesis regulator phasin
LKSSHSITIQFLIVKKIDNIYIELFYDTNKAIKKSGDYQMDNNDWLRQLMMLGVGTTSLVAEKIREVSEEWVKDGKINPEQAKSFVDDLMSQINTGSDSMQKQAERQMKNMLQDLGVPRQAEMDELRGRIDRLERQIRDLENKNWR